MEFPPICSIPIATKTLNCKFLSKRKLQLSKCWAMRKSKLAQHALIIFPECVCVCVFFVCLSLCIRMMPKNATCVINVLFIYVSKRNPRANIRDPRMAVKCWRNCFEWTRSVAVAAFSLNSSKSIKEIFIQFAQFTWKRKHANKMGNAEKKGKGTSNDNNWCVDWCVDNNKHRWMHVCSMNVSQ